MNAKTAITTTIVSGASLLFVALINKLRLKDERDTISKDIAIYKMLPSKSTARSDLLKRIDANIASSLIHNRSVRRDIPGAITILITYASGAAIGLYLVYLASSYNLNITPDWIPPWLYYLISVMLTFYVGLNITAKLERYLRDENGNPVTGPHKPPLLIKLFGRVLK